MDKIILNPAFSNLRGRTGNIVFYMRSGKQCLRTYVIPRNPDTEPQRKVRASFADAVAAWQALSVEQKIFWISKARIKKRRGYNMYLSEYMKAGAASMNILSEKVSDAGMVSTDLSNPLLSFTAGVPLRSLNGSTPLSQALSLCGSGLWSTYFETCIDF